RSLRSSSSKVGASTKIVTAPGIVSCTRNAPSVSRSSSGTLPFAWIRSISERSVPERAPQGRSTYSRNSSSSPSRSNFSGVMNQYSRPFCSPGRCSRVVAETANSSSGMRSSNSLSSVPLPAPEVPVTTRTRPLLPVEETNQLRPLTVGEASYRLRLADPAHVQEARRLHPSELRHRHQHVENLRRRHVLGWIAEDLFDLNAPVLQVLLQSRSTDSDIVRSFQRFHSLIE